VVHAVERGPRPHARWRHRRSSRLESPREIAAPINRESPLMTMARKIQAVQKQKPDGGAAPSFYRAGATRQQQGNDAPPQRRTKNVSPIRRRQTIRRGVVIVPRRVRTFHRCDISCQDLVISPWAQSRKDRESQAPLAWEQGLGSAQKESARKCPARPGERNQWPIQSREEPARLPGTEGSSIWLWAQLARNRGRDDGERERFPTSGWSKIRCNRN